MFGNVPLKDRFFAIYHGKITTLRFVAFLLTLLTPSVPPAPLRPNRRRRRWGEGTSSATTTPPRSTRSAAGRSTAATSARWSTGEPASALISVAFVFLHFPFSLPPTESNSVLPGPNRSALCACLNLLGGLGPLEFPRSVAGLVC